MANWLVSLSHTNTIAALQCVWRAKSAYLTSGISAGVPLEVSWSEGAVNALSILPVPPGLVEPAHLVDLHEVVRLHDKRF